MAVGDLPEARVIPSVKQAWTNMWPHFWWLLLFGLLAALATGIQWDEADPSPALLAFNIAGGLIGVFVGIPLTYGVVRAHLAASRGEKPTWQHLGYAFSARYWPSIGLALLTLLIVVGGLILLIIPGIYWGVKLMFAVPRFIEDGSGIMEAIRASRADVTGRWWSVFGLALMAIPLFVAGALALGVGVLVALVLVSQMHVVYWRALQN